MSVGQTREYIISKHSLLSFLQSSGNVLADLVYWNNELVSLGEALRRASSLSGREQIARRQDQIFVACHGALAARPPMRRDLRRV